MLSHIHAQNQALDEVQIRPPGERLILWRGGHWVAEMRVSFPHGVIEIALFTERRARYPRTGGPEVLLEHFGVSCDWRHPIANDITRLACLATGQTDPMFPRWLFTNIRFLFEYELLIVNAGYDEIAFQAIGNGNVRYGKSDEKPREMPLNEWHDWIQSSFGLFGEAKR